VALRPPRTTVPGSTMAAGAHVPHDLAGFVVEQALDVRHGFWGCVAEGATFRSLGRRRTQPGRALVRAHAGDLDDAERRVNAAVQAWLAGAPTPATTALDDALARWRALPEGGELVLTWATPPRQGGRRRS
jgi:hypothetical protein